MELFTVLQQAGVDVETTLHRFVGNAALLNRFVKKFAQDPTYQQLRDAVAAGDVERIETSAHTLKGTAANLGFQKLSDNSAALVSAIREQKDAEQVRRLFQAVQEEYQKLLSLIDLID
ncbi:Hpt domain-containing protein [Butyricicoccus faecihominis]|uniref:Hpt domain-containing protein n=1 Tax=Butyricicoccaceae TaxID=3085642 RepID=UPI0024785CAE|nr:MULTISPECIES: Hpt domain-containing protein [Butyricicoccaceae]MCQ5128316.1 Hpt domain-containing protein [Butyricicoccus faecihominis]WNX86559.1 Hpt domain-containing protein [Agathobaculum sp. NTUH-O15-33]